MVRVIGRAAEPRDEIATIGSRRTDLERLWKGVVGAQWPGTRPNRAFFELVAQATGRNPAGKAIVAGGPQAELLARLMVETWPRLEVHAVQRDEDESLCHARLSVAAPFDVALQTADTDAQAQLDLFQRTFMHLGVNGVYVTPRVVPAGTDDVRSEAAGPVLVPNEDLPSGVPFRDLWTLVSAAQGARMSDYATEPENEPTYRDIRGLGRHLAEVHFESKIMLITNGRRTGSKLTESEADEVLSALPELGSELAAVPSVTLTARGASEHNLREDPYFRAVMTSPKITLRVYEAPICSRGQVVTRENFLFPDSFRHHMSPRLTNIYVEESAPRFGYVRRDVSTPDELPGSWFHLDSEWPDEFGHFTTEVIGRMWAWDIARRQDPDIRVLTTFRHDREPKQLTPYAREVFTAFGIASEDVLAFERPCRPERLYSATSMFSSYDYIHPDISQVWDRLANALAPDATAGSETGRRIFCTRPIALKRSCRNTPEVENLFAQYGFDVVAPETMSFGEQVRMFRGAEFIAGFAGSALFQLAFCDKPKQVFTIGPDSYTARNEHMIAAVRGHHITSTWCRAELPHPPGSWTKTAFGSAYTFDMESDGRFLRERLELALSKSG
jgi:capsular polysaccharide biosynthesis protein